MEKKKLVINAALCDLRGATEKKLENYSEIAVNSATVIVSKESQELLAKHPVQLNTADMIEVPDDSEVAIVTQNGSCTIGASNGMPKQKTILIANGTLSIETGAEAALESYLKITVNGTVEYPESMAAVLSGKLTVNGSATVYPDGAILLKRNFVMDDLFFLRAKEALYYAARRIVMVHPDIDPKVLADKGVRFKTKQAIIAKSHVASAVPLFDDATEITVVPDGCAFINDDVALTPAILKRHGGKLYINGDLTVRADAADCFGSIEYLFVNGVVRLPADLEDAFLLLNAEYDALKVVSGRVIGDKPMVRIDRAMAERSADGLTVVDCGIVKLAPDLSAELIEARLSFESCGVIRCTEEQEGAAALKAEDCGMIGAEGEGIAKMIGDSLGFGDTKVINAATYRM